MSDYVELMRLQLNDDAVRAQELLRRTCARHVAMRIALRQYREALVLLSATLAAEGHAGIGGAHGCPCCVAQPATKEGES